MDNSAELLLNSDDKVTFLSPPPPDGVAGFPSHECTHSGPSPTAMVQKLCQVWETEDQEGMKFPRLHLGSLFFLLYGMHLYTSVVISVFITAVFLMLYIILSTYQSEMLFNDYKMLQ